MSELRKRVLVLNKINKFKERLYEKWLDCFEECYNKSYYKAKCGIYLFEKFCERKHTGSA